MKFLFSQVVAAVVDFFHLKNAKIKPRNKLEKKKE